MAALEGPELLHLGREALHAGLWRQVVPFSGPRVRGPTRRAGATAPGAGPAGTGVDGCGGPVNAMSRSALATVYAGLASPASLGDLEPQARTCIEAMLAEPYMVGGRDRVRGIRSKRNPR